MDIQNMFSVEGLTCLITGGTSGLGLYMAQALAANGATVFVTSRASALPEQQRDLAQRIRHVGYFDLSEMEGIERLTAAVQEQCSHLDILINNASAYSPAGLHETESDVWDEMFDANLRSTVFLTRALLPLLKAAARPDYRPRVINIGSVVGTVPGANLAYALSKTGVHQLTVSLAAQLVHDGINVNAIAPGAFITSMTREVLDETFSALIPIGRLGMPTDIQAAAVYLCAPASDSITGHILPVDGGLAALRGAVAPRAS